MQHRKGKNHKRRVRALKEQPYTQKEAEAAVGLGVRDYEEEKRALGGKEVDAVDAVMEVDGEVQG